MSDRFITAQKPFREAAPDMWRMVINTNVNGVFLMTCADVPHMLKQRSGRIINISMNHETMKRKGFTPYGVRPVKGRAGVNEHDMGAGAGRPQE